MHTQETVRIYKQIIIPILYHVTSSSVTFLNLIRALNKFRIYSFLLSVGSSLIVFQILLHYSSYILYQLNVLHR
jgi:hypothetical protein